MDEVKISHGVMEGKGAYNKHANTQAAGAALATPFLEKAVQKIALEPQNQPVSLPTMVHRKAKTRSLPCASQLESYGSVSAQSGRF